VPFRFPSFASVLLVVFITFMAPIYVGDLLRRGRAGPVRFRLPLASMSGAKAAWRMTSRSWILLIAGVLVCVSMGLGGDLPGALFIGVTIGTIFVGLPMNHTRRDRLRWAGWVAAGVALAGAAVLMTLGCWTLITGFASPKSPLWKTFDRLTLILLGAFYGVSGVYQVADILRGTLLRERVVELFGQTRLWQQVTVEGWSPDEDGGFLLRLKLLSPQLFGLKLAADSDTVVPVAAAVRPEVESFLAEKMSECSSIVPKSDAHHSLGTSDQAAPGV